MSVASGNIFAGIPSELPDEHVSALLALPELRIERIVSRGHSSTPGVWYDQDRPEWVILLAGEAGLLFAGEAAPRTLKPGDHLHIPAHSRHRVEWTAANRDTIWLAVHHR